MLEIIQENGKYDNRDRFKNEYKQNKKYVTQPNIIM